MDRARTIKAINIANELDRRKRENKLAYYQPYAKQRLFHGLGRTENERCFMAGNQLGKTLAGAAEVAMHATGIYPDWWDGLIFYEPVVIWACGETGEAIRDSIQLLLCGDIKVDGDLGHGYIPKDKIDGISRARGVPNLLDSVQVKHVKGGTSNIVFKAYKKGRTKFQASTIHFIWFDEEPPEDIYSEGLTRTNLAGTHSMLTYTPLLGMSSITHQFYKDPKPGQVLVNMTIEDVEHYSPERKKSIIAGYPDHERDARARGIPILGSGRVFQVADSVISEPHISDIPPEWARINGLDFGWDHPQACVQIAWDRDQDVMHIIREFRERECLPVLAAQTIKGWGVWVPTAWPHDGYQHDKGSGKQLAAQYREAGLSMLTDHATHEKGGYGVEAGISEMIERMRTGRWKVDETLREWWEEYRMYHRKDGQIVKDMDDLMSASRYALMMRRHAIMESEYIPDYIPGGEQQEIVFDSLWQ